MFTPAPRLKHPVSRKVRLPALVTLLLTGFGLPTSAHAAFQPMPPHRPIEISLKNSTELPFVEVRIRGFHGKTPFSWDSVRVFSDQHLIGNYPSRPAATEFPLAVAVRQQDGTWIEYQAIADRKYEIAHLPDPKSAILLPDADVAELERILADAAKTTLGLVEVPDEVPPLYVTEMRARQQRAQRKPTSPKRAPTSPREPGGIGKGIL